MLALKKDGILIFQMPDSIIIEKGHNHLNIWKIIKEIFVIMWKIKQNKNYQIQMNCISKNQIIDIIKENNGIFFSH